MFDDDRNEVIDRARNVGIDRILNPGIDIPSSRIAVSLAEQYEEVFAAVGIHPNSALTWNDRSKDELVELARHPKVVGIGEIGLDYYRDHSPHNLQRDIFHTQLELAADLNLPVIIHNRQATDELLTMLQRWLIELDRMSSPLLEGPGVLHSYSDNATNAEVAFSNNFMIGISGPVTFKNARNLQKTVSETILDCILIETDAPFLTPHPHRGSRNEPGYVRYVADKIAQLQGLSIDNVARKTTANSDRLFKWRDIG